MIDFLSALMGPDIVFTRGAFQRTNPGSPCISMHTDGQPFGSSIFDYEGSSPRLLRVLYYLDDLNARPRALPPCPPAATSPSTRRPTRTFATSPTRRSLLSAPKAGSALIIPTMLFHATHPNTDSAPRELVQFGYRPAWAGPVQPMEEWDPDLVAAAPEQAKPFLQSPNTTGGTWGLEHKPAGMTTAAPGINPSRWSD